MAYGSSNCGCGCGSNNCNTCPQTNPCAPKCKAQMTTAELGELVYISGLDINLCKKYSTIIDALGLNDCAGNPITASTGIVTCGQFQTEFCTLLTALTTGGPVTTGTVLIGADCVKHVMPAFQGPITVLDTTTIDLTLTAGNVLSGVVNVSDDVGNIITIHADGIYANVCTGITALPAGTPAVAGTALVGADCQTHAFPAFQTPITVADTSCLDLTLAAGVLSGVPVVSPAVGNQLACTPAGLFVQPTVVPPETPITPVDTNSVNLTVSGVNGHTLQADVIISPTAGNSTSTTANGVYTPNVCNQFQAIGGIVLPPQPGDIVITRDCVARSLPVNGGVTVADTVTVDMNLAGSVITSNVNVSNVTGNILEIRPDGLSVRCVDIQSCIPDTNIVAADSSCIDVTVTESPANTFTIGAAPIISPLVGNQISCTANGLFVPPASGQATSITCAALQAAFVDNPLTISPGQRIMVDNCQTYLAPSYVELDTASVDTEITVDANGNPVFSATVKVAPTIVGFPANCNGLQATAQGLIAPPNSTGNFGAVTYGSNFINRPMALNEVVSSPLITVNVSNPSDCRSAILVLDMIIPGFNLVSSANFGVLSVQVNHSFNLPGVAVTVLGQFSGTYLIGVANLQNGSTPGDRFFYFQVPPGFTGSYTVQWVFTQQEAASVNTIVGNIGARYFLYTI